MSAHLRVTVRTFDFARHCGEIHVCRPDASDRGPGAIMPPPIVLTNGEYLLVPEGEIGAAFASLQDAGEAAGCPPGQKTLDFIAGQRSILAEAMSTLEALTSGERVKMVEAGAHAEELVRNYKEARKC